MPRRVGIHDCNVRYRHDMGLYTVLAIIEGDVRSPSAIELILDTGAAHLSVKPSLFTLIKPRNVRLDRIVGASGTAQPSQRGLVDIVVDGRLRVNDVDIMEIGELPYRNISGLLGMSFIQHFGVYFHAKTLHARQTGGAPMPLLRFHYFNDDNYEKG